ncbi:MAG: glutathione S-transferase family protein [Rhodospirillaceae bacterium]|nr:glutathione S-transferase family protein [Rhodospirillaceae bacterium]MDD9913509.1 glutathione S-transferase family protein [Rhodospirillaceae bacterium]MDD9926727.1 glutathione S-transferase family protein [Rhodospirillaceae bacterium]
MLTIWGRPTSARTQKVLWALAETGIEFEMILASGTMGPNGSVDKGNEPYGIVDTPEYRAMNPNGTVPTIKDGGFTLWESNSIIQYLAMKYAPDVLFGDDLETFASASRWMDWEGNTFLPHQHTLVMHLVRLPPEERDPAQVESARQALLRPLHIIDDQLAKTPFIAGERFTMGDIPVGMRVHRWFLFDLQTPDLPNLTRWYEVIRQRPAFLEHIADPAVHLSG